MSGESYTRWRSEPSDDEDEEGRAIKGGDEGGHGRSSVTVVTPTSRIVEHLQDASHLRILCVLVLVCAICTSIGGLIGYSYAKCRHHPSSSSPPHVVVPEVRNSTFEKLDDTDKDYLKSISRLRTYLQPETIEKYVRELSHTSNNHLADYIENTWRSQGLETTTTTFTVDISKPDRGRPNTVDVVYKDGHKEILNPLPEDLDSPPFLAYSPAGVVSGPVVYGHYGRREDLQTLQSLKVNIKGTILLLRHGKLHAGSKVHNAQQAGAAGVLFYPDPVDFQGKRGGGHPYPNGTGLPEDGVIWKTLSTLPGDPATPFLPSLDHIYKASRTGEQLPGIPAHTISSRVAGRLMTMMHGPQVPVDWRGGLDLVLHGGIKLEYNLGGAWLMNVTNLTLATNNEIYHEKIKNIHATLPATDNTRVIMIGCHYGSLHREPGVGLASLLALSESLQKALSGTQRKVMFSAWAAGQQGMIGSTEFTQLYAPWVDKKLLGYLNLDEMLVGTGTLRVMASPSLRESIRKAATMVDWPLSSKSGVIMNVKDGWGLTDPLKNNEVHISSPGSGSDFVSFTAQHGVPSAHFIATSQDWASTYSLRHSQYDNLQAYTQFLDPEYKWTHMISSLVGAVTITLSVKELPPVVFSEMSGELYNGWQRFLDLHAASLNNSEYSFHGILDAIEREIVRLDRHMASLDNWYHEMTFVENKVFVDKDHQRFFSAQHLRQVEERLQQLMMLERGLLGPRGVGRPFTTNVMVGPDPEDPERPIHYPHAARAITLALLHKTPWASVHQELSYILAALASYRQLFPLQLDEDLDLGNPR